MVTPLPWQTEPVRILADAIRNNRAALDGSDTGVGKTLHTLFAAKEAGLPVGVICPKAVIPSWQEWMQRVGVTIGFVSNIEALKADQVLLQGDGKKWKWNVPRCVLVFDEVHRFSAPDSENAHILACAPKPVLMLSATAAPDPTRLRAIGHQLGITSWQEWWHWCGRNGCKRGYFGGIEFKGKQEHLDRLHRQIFKTKLGVRVRIAELGDQFPDCRLETINVPVKDQKEINKAYALELKALEEAAPNAAVQVLRARQVSEHAKLKAVIELAEDHIESGRSVVFFVNFRESLSQLTEFFDCPAVYGDQDPLDRAAAIKQFQSGEAVAIVCMIQAGGEAISLHDLEGTRPRSSFILPGWSARELIQAKGRTHRAGGKSPAFIYFVFADGTIEERIRRKVDAKLANISTLNDGDLTMSNEPAQQVESKKPRTRTRQKQGAPVQPSEPQLPVEGGVKAADGSGSGSANAPVQGKDTAVKHQERKHATISPSKLKYLELSPLWKNDENQKEHALTTIGTEIHEAIETGNLSKLGEDEKALAQKCLDFLATFNGYTSYPEIQLDVLGGIFGYADLVLVKGQEAVLLDWKTGGNRQEAVETNPAAQAYVLGVFNKFSDVKKVDVYYAYPRLDIVDACTYTREDVFKIELRLKTIVARTGGTVCEAHVETCTYCGHKAVCPYLKAFALPIATRYQEKHQELSLPAEYDPALISDPAVMAKALALASVMDKWCESVKFHALKLRQETGADLPGYDYKTRTGRKRIVNPLITWQIAQRYGVTQDEFLSAADISLPELAEAVSAKAERGQKKKAAEALENELRDQGALEIGPEIFFLQRSK